MNESSKTYWTDNPDLVEKYILGQITEEERKQLDAEIADCEPCKEKLRVEQELAAGIKRHGREQLKSNLRRRLKKEEGKQLQRYSYVGLAAAVAFVLIGAGVYKFWFSDFTWPTKFNKKTFVIKQSAPQPDSVSAKTEPTVTDGGKLKENNLAGTTEASADAKGFIDKDEQSQTRQKTELAPVNKKRLKNIASSSVPEKPVTITVKPFSQKVWLIGSVVMVQNNASANSAKSLALRKDTGVELQSGRAAETIAQAKSFSVTKKTGSQQIILEQRPLYELPASRRTQLAATHHIETLVEHTEKGISLVMYNDNLKEDELKNAKVEVTRGDSLIVTMDDQKIIYRLPTNWNFQERTLKQ
jgi:hypothetical protein